MYLLYTTLGLLFWTVFMTENLYNYVSDIHAAGALLLAISSLAEILSNKWLMIWSVTYFMIDTVELIVKMKVMYILHHSLAILIVIIAINDPVLAFETNAGPKIMLIEFSTLFLNYWQRDKHNFPKYIMLILVYFFNRIVYLGHFAYFSYSITNTIYGIGILYILRTLHLLMCLWFLKLLGKCSKVFDRWHYNLHTDFNHLDI